MIHSTLFKEEQSKEHSKSDDGKLYNAEDGSMWLVNAGRSVRVDFVLGDEDGDSSLGERRGQSMCEVGVDHTQSPEMIQQPSRLEDDANI